MKMLSKVRSELKQIYQCPATKRVNCISQAYYDGHGTFDFWNAMAKIFSNTQHQGAVSTQNS
ncbi:MAG: hypothetical protein ACTS73_01345 [Arsenophonus sp. NEOnobi-MAG3]